MSSSSNTVTIETSVSIRVNVLSACNNCVPFYAYKLMFNQIALKEKDQERKFDKSSMRKIPLDSRFNITSVEVGQNIQCSGLGATCPNLGSLSSFRVYRI